MYALTQSEPALFTNDPEALLYGGLPPWASSARLKPRLVKGEYLQTALPPAEQQLLAAAAIQNFETGRAETAGNESRS